jgi:hypothetical protein
MRRRRVALLTLQRTGCLLGIALMLIACGGDGPRRGARDAGGDPVTPIDGHRDAMVEPPFDPSMDAGSAADPPAGGARDAGPGDVLDAGTGTLDAETPSDAGPDASLDGSTDDGSVGGQDAGTVVIQPALWLTAGGAVRSSAGYRLRLSIGAQPARRNLSTERYTLTLNLGVVPQ